MLLPSDEVRNFIFATFRWMIRMNGGVDALVRRVALVTPTVDDFPVYPGLEGAALAEDYFAFVREHAHIGTRWRFALVEAEEALPLPLPPTEPVTGPLPIPYPRRAAPAVLIAHFAHALSYYAIRTRPEQPPGGWESLAATVELGAVCMGFGIFMANSVLVEPAADPVRFVVWRQPRRWALSEPELAYALAVFGWVKEIPDALITRYLLPNPSAFYWSAVRDLRRRGDELAELSPASLRSRAGPYR